MAQNRVNDPVSLTHVNPHGSNIYIYIYIYYFVKGDVIFFLSENASKKSL